ncbi:hypothetical protein B7494_g937 [Chlorociboria aeruginascens]|nr:hypothetical protein B7494_g937 [Chlorociboria aeruginascens]
MSPGFHVRLNCIDSYQSTPTYLDPQLRTPPPPNPPPHRDPHLRNNPNPRNDPPVPVIRVFGATETGQKVPPPRLTQNVVGTYIHRLHLSIDHALAVSYRANLAEGKAEYVARITLVKGIPFYGFHVGYRYYLKIYMLDPIVMTRLADLLRQGVVLKQDFQPFEAHLEYLLQWMADYNLYGCDYIHASRVTFRGPVPKYEDVDHLSHRWHDRSINEDQIVAQDILPRVSHCAIEVDICVEDILNRKEIKARPLHHDFVERLRPLATDERLVPSMAGLWKDETRRRKSRMSYPDPGSSPFPPEVLLSMSADSRNSQPGGWIHEEEYMEKILSLVSEERKRSDGAQVSFESFVQTPPFDSTVKTALEAVEDLYPHNLRVAFNLTPVDPKPDGQLNVSGNAIADEKRISSFGTTDSELIDDEEGSENSLGDDLTRRNMASQSQELLKRYGNSIMQDDERAKRRKTSTWYPSDSMPSSLKSSGFGSSPSVPRVLRNMAKQFMNLENTVVLAVGETPPTSSAVVSTMQDCGLPPVIYQDAFYSRDRDVPERAREWAGREFKLGSLTVPFLPDFDPTGTSNATFGERRGIIVDKAKEERHHERRRRATTFRSWAFADLPPTYMEVDEWVRTQETTTPSRSISSPRREIELSQIDGPTQKNRHGFKYTQNQKTTSVEHVTHYMSTMSLEIHVNTRGNFVPNPEEDEVQCLFWCLQSEEDDLESNGSAEGTYVGVVALSGDGFMPKRISRQTAIAVQEESSELDLLIRIVEIVRSYDPDILTGYEVHGSSWGYLIERARLKYDYNLCDELSRMKSQSHGRFGKGNDKWGFNHTSTIRVTGRHMINIWRAMRSELNLLQYTMENVVFHLLHRRIPHFTWADLTYWYTNLRSKDLAKVIDYYISRVQLNLDILEENELISRTSEQARLLGVDFFSVFSRGSQYKVESLMFRIAKPENFILVSPSRKQVGGQNALECLPLVMEPQSAFYNSPLLVLDFQSLYPSVMIAYNYCYSTFLGRIVNWRGTNKMGFTEFKRQQRLLELLKDHINIAPNGMMYTKPEIRKSLLAKMLGEILETRIMVKSGMKLDKDDRTLQRLLNNRQLALKLIANVTYGYTSASFSGRMPCSEIADSIVQTGRETLEKAIALIHSVKRWDAEVVYGDTDSIFVYLKGRTKDQAFDIGNEIAKTVTNMNPRPVKLKFEKVYLPCVLLAKKRYVGFKYESRDQVEPDFDAKGIETVRRDGTPAEQKIEEKALKILFRTADLSEVKSYFQKQCEKIMKGSISIQDFCFAREVKLGTYSEKGPPPAGALISTKRMREDARAEPQYGERVPYVVIAGAPGARLIDRCVAPEKLLENDHNELDSEYYITKNLIPPLERIFNLVGANVRSWYDEMPKYQRIRRIDTNIHKPPMKIRTLEFYMKSSSCLVCKEKLDSKDSTLPFREEIPGPTKHMSKLLRDITT